MEPLRLYWLGHPLVELGGRAVKVETRKAVALLSYLSLTPGICQRELLATMFWPEGSQQKALASLRRSLSSFKVGLPGWIQAERTTVTLNRNDNLWIDINTFDELFSQVEKHCPPEAEICEQCLSILMEAVRYYRGDFLEGLNLNDCPTFDDWQFFQRDSFHQEISRALQRLSHAYSHRNQWEQAITYSRRRVSLDRLNESAQRALMDLYIRSGQRAAAMHQYAELTLLLHEQLGQEPEQETQRLYEKTRGEEAKQICQPSKYQDLFTLLKTKLYIPTAPVSRVVRLRLIDSLNTLEQNPLTLISAPAGFGKTTLLAEWIAQTSQPVAWLSLDKGDNDLYRFLSYLVAALESIQEGVGREAQQLILSSEMVPAHLILASLINDLGKIPEPYVLVLDDYQFISEHAVHETMAYLLDHIPTNMHLIISTRADPPLKLGRLRAYGQMRELRIQDMRFTPKEALELLNGVMKLGLSEKDIITLEEKTEGWIVGLQMAGMSLANREEKGNFIQTFSGSNRYVMDYLLDEVLALKDPYVEHFLIATSTLDRLSGSLCDAVLEKDWPDLGHLSGQEMLEHLEAANMFVVPLDDNRLWYRYHHLFAELLHTREGKYSPEQISKFRLRASLWCDEQGLPLDAIKYALDGGDDLRAATLIDRMSKVFISPTDFSELQSYINRLPMDIIREHPWTCLAQTHIWVTLGEVDAVEEWLDWVEPQIQKKHKHGRVHQDDDLAATVNLHRAYVRLFNDDLPSAAKLGTTALQKLQPSQLHLRCRLNLLVGEAYLLQGLFEKSNLYLREAIALCKTCEDMFLLTTACYRLTIQLKLQGKLSEAESIYEENIQLLKSFNLASSHLMVKPQIGLGDIYRERGQLEMAERLLTAGTEKAEQLGHSQDLVYAYSLMARLMQARGNIEQALEFLERNISLFQLNPIPEAIVQGTKNLRASICLLWDKPNRAEEWKFLQPNDLNAKIDFLNELDFTTLARWLIVCHDYARATQLLRQLAELAEKEGRIERLIKVLILQAIALNNSGETDKAMATLIRSLALAEPEGYQRIFLDEGGPLLLLLKRLIASEAPTHIQHFAHRLLAAGTASPYACV